MQNIEKNRKNTKNVISNQNQCLASSRVLFELVFCPNLFQNPRHFSINFLFEDLAISLRKQGSTDQNRLAQVHSVRHVPKPDQERNIFEKSRTDSDQDQVKFTF